MLVCHVSQRPVGQTIAADLTEAALALDASNQGLLVLATLIDDPASVGDVTDAYLGEIMVETASASDATSVGALYSGDIAESGTASDVPDASKTGAPPALDGTPGRAHATSGSSINVTSPTTTNATDVLVLFSLHNISGVHITGITDNSGKTATWQSRSSLAFGTNNFEEWYTTTTGTISAATITVTYSAATNFST